jgi:hypothetical protein
MLNLIQKLHALIVCSDVTIWHFPAKSEGPKFFYWLTAEPENKDGYGFETFDHMIEAAYAHIDPLQKSMPETVEAPPQARGPV